MADPQQVCSALQALVAPVTLEQVLAGTYGHRTCVFLADNDGQPAAPLDE